MSSNTLLTKVATSVFFEIKEVFTPDLDECLTVLRSVAWVNRMYYGL